MNFSFFKKPIFWWQVFCFIFISLGGTLLHFLYDWSNKSVAIAPFSGVNESTWEHMKLFFFPAVVFAILQSFFFDKNEFFWQIKLYGTLVGLIVIPVIFYVYNGAIGKSPDWLNITIFFIATAVGSFYEYRTFTGKNPKSSYPEIAVLCFCLLALAFMVFTFLTPELGIFKDPVYGTYGIY